MEKLKELLFERCVEAREMYLNSDKTDMVMYHELFDTIYTLIKDSGLEDEYYHWRKSKED